MCSPVWFMCLYVQNSFLLYIFYHLVYKIVIFRKKLFNPQLYKITTANFFYPCRSTSFFICTQYNVNIFFINRELAVHKSLTPIALPSAVAVAVKMPPKLRRSFSG